jgi:predicted dehydrogenase
MMGWGILATGKIARSFARDLTTVPGAEVVAAGSRRIEAATAFVEEYGGRPHGSYEELVADPAVDVVYIASPHALHLEHATLAFGAGKPVLCEKPLTLNAQDAATLFERAGDLFCMEAMWTACHPVVREVVERVRAGRYGEPRQVHADLGFLVDADPDSRLLDPALGAGALLDMGIYPLTLADLVLGPIEQATATATLSDRGADLDVAIATRHHSGAVGALTASMTSWSPRTATIATSEGRIEIPADFHHPPYAVWVPRQGEPERISGAAPVLGSGLGNEALHVQECLAEGLIESPLVPHAQTLRLLGVMDDLRAQIGVRYGADG